MIQTNAKNPLDARFPGHWIGDTADESTLLQAKIGVYDGVGEILRLYVKTEIS